jgi:hypothetical protein
MGWMACFELLPARIITRRYFQVSAFEDQIAFLCLFHDGADVWRRIFASRLTVDIDAPNSYATTFTEKEQYLVDKGLR